MTTADSYSTNVIGKAEFMHRLAKESQKGEVNKMQAKKKTLVLPTVDTYQTVSSQ